MFKRNLFLLIALCIMISACTVSEPVSDSVQMPPESILYLGGAAILDGFSIEGGPSSHDGMKSIVILSPPDLEKECLTLAIIGTTEDGTQDILFTEADILPSNYYVIEEETYRSYVELMLWMDYSWNGIRMSTRNVNLFTLEEFSSVATEFNLAD